MTDGRGRRRARLGRDGQQEVPADRLPNRNERGAVPGGVALEEEHPLADRQGLNLPGRDGARGTVGVHDLDRRLQLHEDRVLGPGDVRLTLGVVVVRGVLAQPVDVTLGDPGGGVTRVAGIVAREVRDRFGQTVGVVERLRRPARTGTDFPEGSGVGSGLGGRGLGGAERTQGRSRLVSLEVLVGSDAENTEHAQEHDDDGRTHPPSGTRGSQTSTRH